jgi:hypothetical protein
LKHDKLRRKFGSKIEGDKRRMKKTEWRGFSELALFTKY